MHQSKDEIINGILQGEDLDYQIVGDYQTKRVDGPIEYSGQDQFINMYLYKDSAK